MLAAMDEATLFVDESGLFRSATCWPSGMRVVGGVVVPRPHAEASRLCGAALRRALASADAAWFEGDVHATDLLHPPDVARRILDSREPDGSLARAAQDILRAEKEREGAARGSSAWRRLREFGGSVLTSIEHSIGPMLDELDAEVVVVTEYGSVAHAGEGTRLVRYPRMAEALIRAAILRTGRTATAPWRLVAVMASGQPGANGVSAEVWLRKLAKLREQEDELRGTLPNEALVRIADARDDAGLQVADVVVHALGPGAQHELTPTPAAVLGRTLAQAATDARVRLRVAPERYEEHDALEGHEALMAVAASPRSETARSERIAKALALATQRPLPRMLYPSSLEQGARIAPAL